MILYEYMYINHCNTCDKKFYSRFTNEVNKINGRGKFCSKKCYYIKHKKKLTKFSCDNCKKTFERTKQQLTKFVSSHCFCTQDCYWEYRRNHIEEYPTYEADKKCPELNEDLLKKEYLENKLKIKDIAKKYKLGYTTVNMRLSRYKIEKRRSKDYQTRNSVAGWQKYLNKELKHTCEICGWNKTTCDMHHKISLQKGGKNERNNLILVCPNCHRLIHNNLLKI